MKRLTPPRSGILHPDSIGFYKMLAVTSLIHALFFLMMGFFSGPFSNPGYLFAYLPNVSDLYVKVMSLVEIVFSLFYVIPVFLAFRYDLLHEERPKHLLAVLLLEFFAFFMMRFFEHLGGNLVLFLAAGIALCFVIGSSSLGIFLLFDAVIASGSVLLIPLVTLILPLLAIGVFIQTLIDFFG